MIFRIITYEVNRAARERAARNRAAAARAAAAMQAHTPRTGRCTPRHRPPPRPASPPHRSSGIGMAIVGVVAFAGIIALIVVPLTLSKDHQHASIANQQTCADVWQWTAGYDTGLADEIGPASLTPDPQLRADVASLLGDVQDAQIVNDAVVPSQQIKADVSALLGRCDQFGLNPGGSDGASVP